LAAGVEGSRERILTTHGGSLPRPPELLEMLVARAERREVPEERFGAAVREAVGDAVRRQVAAGIDIVSDGEMSKTGFASYMASRMTGFGGESRMIPLADVAAFPEVAPRTTPTGPSTRALRPANDGPIAYVGEAELRDDLDTLRSALDAVAVEGAFLPAASPGAIVQSSPTHYFSSRREYLYALADALRIEYVAITEAGLTLQVDCPDLAMERHVEFAEASVEDFRRAIAEHVEALNHGLAGVDPDRVRVHVCWGNYAGPHHRDVDLRDILDIVLGVRAGAISVEGANPRHEHEWRVFEDVRLPEGRVLIPGVIDTCTNYIEHPEVVAQRLVRYARVVGRENVIAGTDCGFSTFAGSNAVVPDVVWAKLGSLAEGARLATAELWG
jgi:5-methyltetrahydropteroyltriglutamate--homocysteine methyltransferase